MPSHTTTAHLRPRGAGARVLAALVLAAALAAPSGAAADAPAKATAQAHQGRVAPRIRPEAPRQTPAHLGRRPRANFFRAASALPFTDYGGRCQISSNAQYRVMSAYLPRVYAQTQSRQYVTWHYFLVDDVTGQRFYNSAWETALATTSSAAPFTGLPAVNVTGLHKTSMGIEVWWWSDAAGAWVNGTYHHPVTLDVVSQILIGGIPVPYTTRMPGC